ncbi:unnamed protein product, partial [marine sediment metagenome]
FKQQVFNKVRDTCFLLSLVPGADTYKESNAYCVGMRHGGGDNA